MTTSVFEQAPAAPQPNDQSIETAAARYRKECEEVDKIPDDLAGAAKAWEKGGEIRMTTDILAAVGVTPDDFRYVGNFMARDIELKNPDSSEPKTSMWVAFDGVDKVGEVGGYHQYSFIHDENHPRITDLAAKVMGKQARAERNLGNFSLLKGMIFRPISEQMQDYYDRVHFAELASGAVAVESTRKD